MIRAPGKLLLKADIAKPVENDHASPGEERRARALPESEASKRSGDRVITLAIISPRINKILSGER